VRHNADDRSMSKKTIGVSRAASLERQPAGSRFATRQDRFGPAAASRLRLVSVRRAPHALFEQKGKRPGRFSGSGLARSRALEIRLEIRLVHNTN
jgi:hypothetical protein